MSLENFYHNCTTYQKQELASLLLEDNFIIKKDFKFTPNLNDDIFYESLNALLKARHQLSKEDESYINELAKKFKFT